MNMRDMLDMEWELLPAKPTYFVYKGQVDHEFAHVITLALPTNRRCLFKGSLEACLEWSAEELKRDYLRKRVLAGPPNQMAMDFGLGRGAAND